ncbi:MAG TPA: hypothetical protein VEB64_14235 [Azospirillaceae bacterium]|nr:hypothetical protein [Azospirillaceae bacterium]
MRAKIRLLIAGSVVAASTIAAAGPSFAWTPYTTYKSGMSTTRQSCAYEYFYVGSVLYMKNPCTGQVYPALR